MCVRKYPKSITRGRLPNVRWSLLVACFASHQHPSVSQGWICLHKYTCCHTEIEVADQTFYLTHRILIPGRSVPGPTLCTPGGWQGSHWGANFNFTGRTRPGKRSTAQAGIEPRFAALEADVFTTRPTRSVPDGEGTKDAQTSPRQCSGGFCSIPQGYCPFQQNKDYVVPVPPPPSPLPHRLVGLVVKASTSERKIRGSNPACDEIFPGRVIPVT